MPLSITPNKTKASTSNGDKPLYLLMTITSTLESYLEEKGCEKQYQQLRVQFIVEEPMIHAINREALKSATHKTDEKPFRKGYNGNSNSYNR